MAKPATGVPAVAQDQRIVYGARCTWWDSITEAGERPPSPNNPFAATGDVRGLPCCPHCSGVLFEVLTEADWWAQVDTHQAAGHPGYRAYIEWLRGRCFPDMVTAGLAYLDR